MPDFVRRIVSGPKARYVDTKLGIDLDLVYVTDRLIIMGWPASSIEALYRNKRKDVKKFLESRHGHKYRIYNLCPCSENSYEADDFNGSVSRYPFPDHHPPPLSMIPMFVADMTAWFAEDPCNVAVIHCKAGKGRSGTMACSYLLSLPILPPAPQSMRNCGNKYDRKQLEALRQSRESSKEGASPVVSTSTSPEGSRTPVSEVGNETVRPALHLQIDESTHVFPVMNGRASNQTNDDDAKLEELSKRLNAVFAFHTSRRLKPAKSPSMSATSSPLRSRKSSFNASNAGESASPGASPIPIRKRSISHLVQSFKKGNNTPPKLPSSSLEVADGSPRLGSMSNTNLHALGASPAGRSELQLDRGRLSTTKMIRAASQSPDPTNSSLSINSYATVNDGSSTMARRGSEPLTSYQSISRIGQDVPGSGHRTTQTSDIGGMPASYSSQSSSDVSDGLLSPQSHQQDTLLSPPLLSFDDQPASEQENIVAPRLAVSIPSQRRWVGYWARMLAELDPRASLDSHSMHPSRRQVRLLRVYIDRRGTSKNGQNGEGSLSIQIAKYNDKLVDRLETWERNARRRNRVFGALDPGAASPSFPSSSASKNSKTKRGIIEKSQSQAQKDAMKALRDKEDEEGWKDCERQNSNHKEEYDRKMRQHGNDTGVGQWGINVLAEKDTLRAFDWDDDNGRSQQIESIALVSESSRLTLPDARSTRLLSNAGLAERSRDSETNTSIIRYTFEPGNTGTTHSGAHTPLPTWTKPSGAKDTFSKMFRKVAREEKKVQSSTTIDSNTSQSYTSSDMSQSHSANEPASPATSEEFVSSTSERAEKGLLLDADREVQIRILLGRSGATHSRLPDMLSAGYIWMIPSFETPLLKGEKKPAKGQIVKCQFGMNEIDFRKGKTSAPLMGGGDIRSVTVEFEWVEVGWHEEDDDNDHDSEPQ